MRQPRSTHRIYRIYKIYNRILGCRIHQVRKSRAGDAKMQLGPTSTCRSNPLNVLPCNFTSFFFRLNRSPTPRYLIEDENTGAPLTLRHTYDFTSLSMNTLESTRYSRKIGLIGLNTRGSTTNQSVGSPIRQGG